MIKNSERYTEGVIPPNEDLYPYGGSKNSTTDVAEDGFPMDENWFNDVNGLFQAAMKVAGIEPNNISDSLNNPQLLNAFVSLKYSTRLDYAAGSICIGSDGKVYVALKTNGASGSTVNPVGDSAGTWDLLPNKLAVEALIEALKTNVDTEIEGLDKKIEQLRKDMDSVESAIGGGKDRLMYPCDQLMTTSFTLPANKNCFMAGPLKVADGVTLSAPDGARLRVV